MYIAVAAFNHADMLASLIIMLIMPAMLMIIIHIMLIMPAMLMIIIHIMLIMPAMLMIIIHIMLITSNYGCIRANMLARLTIMPTMLDTQGMITMILTLTLSCQPCLIDKA